MDKNLTQFRILFESHCVTFSGFIIKFLIITRSDYFRNFVDSCLQKIAQDRPTSDVLLKVGGIKRTV